MPLVFFLSATWENNLLFLGKVGFLILLQKYLYISDQEIKSGGYML